MGPPLRVLSESGELGAQPGTESPYWGKTAETDSRSSISSNGQSPDGGKERAEFFKRPSASQGVSSESSRSSSNRPLSSFWRAYLLRSALVILLVVLVSEVTRQKLRQLLKPEEEILLKGPPTAGPEPQLLGGEGLDKPSPPVKAPSPPPVPQPLEEEEQLEKPSPPAKAPSPPPVPQPLEEEEQLEKPSPPVKAPSPPPVLPAPPATEVKPAVEVREPPGAAPLPKPDEDFGPLILSLTEPAFAPAGRVTEAELKAIKEKWLEGHPDDVVEVRGEYVLRGQLQDMMPGHSMDVTALHLYCELIQKHLDMRAALGIQEPVRVLSPSLMGEMWKPFLEEEKDPVISEEVKAECKDASKVLFIQPAPAYDPFDDSFSATGHLLLSVIDRKHRRIYIVDSLPQDDDTYYELIAEFVEIIARQLGGLTEDGPYVVSPFMPEGGFPEQPEALSPDLFTEDIYQNACGAFAVESLFAVAEGRKPGMTPEDIPWVRWRMLLELYGGRLRDRRQVDGHVRAAFGELFDD